MATVLTNVQDIFKHGNEHMRTKFQFLSPKQQTVIKYIISKLRKYRGEFWESNKTIATNVGCCIRTVQSAIKKAQALEILQVSSRFESVIGSNKKRQTSNIIRMLKYTAFELVKETIEKVKEVQSVIIKKVSNKGAEKPKHDSKPSTSNNRKNTHSKAYDFQNKQYVRKEIVPDWLNKPYTPIELPIDQQQDFNYKRDDLLSRLKNKYSKGVMKNE